MHIDSIDLGQFSIEDLETLINRAEATIRQVKAKRAGDLRRQVEQTASDLGISVAELVGLEKPAKATKRVTGGKVAAKYCNPANPEQTWTGRGQKPVWLRERLEQGAHQEDFLIR
ncbi:MAG: H-NS histone family protein [Halothiobacillaceae bacterium]|nr:MAG: H-NS histone family protein [Halothiobacillaceae bacterium]